MENNLIKYKVISKKEEVPGVFTLNLTDEKDSVPNFKPGQYINIYFPETSSTGKAYSLSSSPDEQELSITVKVIGEFSKKICALKSGDIIQGSLPYGFFGIEEEKGDVAMLAAGIGITPFRSMIKDAIFKKRSGKIYLFHSVQKCNEAIFKDEFEKLKEESDILDTTYFITRENPSFEAINRRMSEEDILEKINNPEKTEFLLCGSISFTRDLWRNLRNKGVPEDNIYTEAFFSH